MKKLFSQISEYSLATFVMENWNILLAAFIVPVILIGGFLLTQSQSFYSTISYQSGIEASIGDTWISDHDLNQRYRQLALKFSSSATVRYIKSQSKLDSSLWRINITSYRRGLTDQIDVMLFSENSESLELIVEEFQTHLPDFINNQKLSKDRHKADSLLQKIKLEKSRTNALEEKIEKELNYYIDSIQRNKRFTSRIDELLTASLMSETPSVQHNIDAIINAEVEQDIIRARYFQLTSKYANLVEQMAEPSTQVVFTEDLSLPVNPVPKNILKKSLFGGLLSFLFISVLGIFYLNLQSIDD